MPESNSKHQHVLPLAIIGVVVGVVSVLVARLIDWLPDPASVEADRVDRIIWWTVWASIGVFTIVMSVLIYAIWKFRAKPGDESDGPPIHGHTGLEVVWTIIPTIMIGITAAWAAMVVIDNEAIAEEGRGPLYVDVLAQQFAWEFTYPELGITTGDLRVPTDRQVVLNLRAVDVIHSFFVYETRIKGDAVPGITNDRVRFTMKSDTAGKTYPIVCTELCGAGHGIMRTQMRVLSPVEYARWAARAKVSVAGAKG